MQSRRGTGAKIAGARRWRRSTRGRMRRLQQWRGIRTRRARAGSSQRINRDTGTLFPLPLPSSSSSFSSSSHVPLATGRVQLRLDQRRNEFFMRACVRACAQEKERAYGYSRVQGVEGTGSSGKKKRGRRTREEPSAQLPTEGRRDAGAQRGTRGKIREASCEAYIAHRLRKSSEETKWRGYGGGWRRDRARR